MLLDHITMTLVMVPILIVFMIIFGSIFSVFQADVALSPFEEVAFLSLLFFPFTIYFLKDSYRGKSIGKRILGYQVLNRSNDKIANNLQCFIRNLFIIIWPLEVLISLFSPTIRLGDLVANTKVVKAEKEPFKSIFKEIKETKFTYRSIIIVFISIGYSYLLGHIMLFQAQL